MYTTRTTWDQNGKGFNEILLRPFKKWYTSFSSSQRWWPELPKDICSILTKPNKFCLVQFRYRYRCPLNRRFGYVSRQKKWLLVSIIEEFILLAVRRKRNYTFVLHLFLIQRSKLRHHHAIVGCKQPKEVRYMESSTISITIYIGCSRVG